MELKNIFNYRTMTIDNLHVICKSTLNVSLSILSGGGLELFDSHLVFFPFSFIYIDNRCNPPFYFSKKKEIIAPIIKKKIMLTYGCNKVIICVFFSFLFCNYKNR